MNHFLKRWFSPAKKANQTKTLPAENIKPLLTRDDFPAAVNPFVQKTSGTEPTANAVIGLLAVLVVCDTLKSFAHKPATQQVPSKSPDRLSKNRYKRSNSYRKKAVWL